MKEFRLIDKSVRGGEGPGDAVIQQHLGISLTSIASTGQASVSVGRNLAGKTLAYLLLGRAVVSSTGLITVDNSIGNTETVDALVFTQPEDHYIGN